jgi:hypothetical protein
MPATFAPTTDRPRLFDDAARPRARRPAPSGRDRAPTGPDRATPGPDREPATPGFDLAPASPDREPGTPGFDLAPASSELAPASPDLAPREQHPAGAGASRHALTLDHLISGVWDELSAHRTVSCPVCHGQMAPRYGSAEQPVGGRCRRCGSSLG